MRVPIFKITNDDDPMDYEYPQIVTQDSFYDDDGYDPPLSYQVGVLSVGSSITVGGGAAVQFTITRIR